MNNMDLQVFVIGLVLFALTTCHLQCRFDGQKRGSPDLPPEVLQFRPGSGEPYLHKANDRLFLSWIQSHEEQDSFFLVALIDGQWVGPSLIASGNDWFVNWADFPRVHSFAGVYKNHLIATWLVKSDTLKFSYDIYYALTPDLGLHWSVPVLLHDDGIKAEHGFISMSTVDDSLVFVSWLDGRNAQIHQEEGHHGHGGEMSLRGAFINYQGKKRNDIQLDNRVCDCCQTATAVSDNGPVVAYRDRSEEEIRDIALASISQNSAVKSKVHHRDHWNINGCPVNGPAILAKQNKVIYAWYTAPDNLAKCFISFSDDGGNSFSQPVRIDRGNALGRIDMCWLGEQEGLVTWMERSKDEEAELFGGKLLADGKLLESKPIDILPPSRKSGFPQVESLRNNVYLVWTDVADHETFIQMRILPVKYFD